MSNVHGAHPGECERQTRGSPSVTRMLHPGVHDTASCLSRVALVPRRNVRLKVAVQEFDPSHGYWFTSLIGGSISSGASLRFSGSLLGFQPHSVPAPASTLSVSQAPEGGGKYLLFS